MIYLYIIVCNILFIPVIYSNDTTVIKSKVTNNTPPVSVLLHDTQVASEGGSILTDKLLIALPKNNNDIPSLDKEAGKSKIVARKGAGNFKDEITKSSESPVLPPRDMSIKAETIVENSNSTTGQQKATTKNTSTSTGVSTIINKTPTSTSKPVRIPKKPTILNGDILENTPPEVKSSPETVVHSQIQSPNDKIKSYISNANNHPGMVMPIVITILLVPTFAVLGYMALRRGQEAWKNRHYKRMDFLLDGMYND